MGYSADISNDATGWADSLNGIQVGGLSNSHVEQPLPEDHFYDGTDCPDTTFTMFNAAGLAGATVQSMDFEGLFLSVAWFCYGEAPGKLAQSIKDFEADVKQANGEFNVTRHFWHVSHTGRIEGLLMWTTGPCTVKAVAVAGFEGGYKGTKVSMRGTHQQLEQRIINYLAKQLKGK